MQDRSRGALSLSHNTKAHLVEVNRLKDSRICLQAVPGITHASRPGDVIKDHEGPFRQMGAQEIEVVKRCCSIVVPVHECVVDGVEVLEYRGQCLLEEAGYHGGIVELKLGQIARRPIGRLRHPSIVVSVPSWPLIARAAP